MSEEKVKFQQISSATGADNRPFVIALDTEGSIWINTCLWGHPKWHKVDSPDKKAGI